METIANMTLNFTAVNISDPSSKDGPYNNVTENDTESILTNMTSTTVDAASYVSKMMYVSFVISVVLFVVGLLGNITTIIVMQKKPFKSTAHGVYLTALALADTMALIMISLHKECIWYLFGVYVTALNNITCRLAQYLFSATKIASSGMIVLICIERFIATWLPIKAGILLTKRTAVVSVCCVSITAILISGISLPFSGLNGGACSPNVANESLAPLLLPIIVIVHSIIPPFVLLCLTPLTVVKLCHIRAKRVALGNRTEDATVRNATMLISTVFVYFIFVTLTAVVFWIIGEQRVGAFGQPAPWLLVVIEALMTVEQANYSLNFCLYSLTSAEFRNAFRVTFLSTCAFRSA